MNASNQFLIWLDMEMTGLDPVTCVPLQVAIIVTDSDLDSKDEIEITIHQDDSELSSMDDFVTKMHTANGLIESVGRSEVELEEADLRLAAFLGNWCGKGEGLLAGNSIHQDRRFIDAYFPRIMPLLHYRMVDVSTIKELARRWYGATAIYEKTSADHTALADIRESINELQHYRRHLFVHE